MKRLSYILLFILFSIILYSCTDILETIPNDRVSKEIFWRTEQDAILACNAIYCYLPNTTTWTNWDAMSDIGHVTKTTNWQSLVEKGAHDALSSVVLNEWKENYRGIQAANIFLDNVDNVVTSNQALINRLQAEVRTLRAYFYISLAILWGDVPLLTHETTLEESREATRTPVEQVWTFISEELTAAAAVLPITQAEMGRATKGAALAIKARAMLYAKRYSEAATAAKEVMDLDVYDLYPSYKNLFTYEAENNIEVIFDKQYIKSSYQNNLFLIMCPNSVYPQSTANIVPTKMAIDIYQMTNGKEITDPESGFDPFNPYENRDPRLKYNYIVIGSELPNGNIYDSRPGSGTADAVGYAEISTPTGFNVNKYMAKEDMADPSNGGLNTILLRYAEVLLTYAEAKIEANQIDESVLDAINKIRQRPDVNMPPYTGITSQEDLRKIVRDERLMELPFEGLRYYDIRRWRIAEQTVPGPLMGMTYVDIVDGTLKTVSISGFVRTFRVDRDYLWPIPQTELDVNDNLTQNPNW